MQSFIDELVHQTSGMGFSTRKTKDMFFSSMLKDPMPSVTLTGDTVKRVATFKLLGVRVSNYLKRVQHIQAPSAKGALRLYHPKQLKRAGAGIDDLLCIHCSMIRPVLNTPAQSGIPA